MNYLPTPYPTKFKFQTIQNPSSNTSSYPIQIASLKKEFSELEAKVSSLTKLNKKLDKKSKEQGDFVKFYLFEIRNIFYIKIFCIY